MNNLLQPDVQEELLLSLKRIEAILWTAFSDRLGALTEADALPTGRKRILDACATPKTRAEIRKQVTGMSGGELNEYVQDLVKRRLLGSISVGGDTRYIRLF